MKSRSAAMAMSAARRSAESATPVGPLVAGRDVDDAAVREPFIDHHAFAVHGLEHDPRRRGGAAARRARDCRAPRRRPGVPGSTRSSTVRCKRLLAVGGDEHLVRARVDAAARQDLAADLLHELVRRRRSRCRLPSRSISGRESVELARLAPFRRPGTANGRAASRRTDTGNCCQSGGTAMRSSIWREPPSWRSQAGGSTGVGSPAARSSSRRIAA